MILLLVNACFLLLYAWLIFFYYRAWKAVPLFKSTQQQAHTFISVIVAARNEEQHIPSLLQALNNQTYSCDHFELIIVDDFSTDGTAALIREAASSHVLYIQPPVSSEHSSKKKAIEAGIHAARGELIVTTDADCLPPPQWLETINDFYVRNGASFIAAPVRFQNNNSFLQIFQCLDFITLQGITAASVGAGVHTMCNGANLAYRRQSFMDVNGFDGIDRIATGDDMLLMFKIWKREPAKVFYLKSRDAIVDTEPMPSLKSLIMQRKRWASKTLVYDDYRIIAVLAFVYLFNCLFVVLVIASLLHSIYWWYALAFLLIKTIIEIPFVYTVSRFYEQQKLLRFFFMMQPFHIFYTVIVGFISQWGRYEWKGRRTK